MLQQEQPFSIRVGSTINANEFNVTAGAVFYNQSSATINADNLNITAEAVTFSMVLQQSIQITSIL